MFYHQVAETVEEFCPTVLSPLLVLLAAVEIKKLIAYGQLRQQGLIAVGHFLVSMVGDDDELVHNGQQMISLLVGQRTDGCVVDFS